jgi:hypothetical protein
MLSHNNRYKHTFHDDFILSTGGDALRSLREVSTKHLASSHVFTLKGARRYTYLSFVAKAKFRRGSESALSGLQSL